MSTLNNLLSIGNHTPIWPEGTEIWYRYDGYEHPDCYAFRVRKHTPCGVWLEIGYGIKDKWVSNSTRKRWAYPDKAAALESFRMRKLRQFEHLTRMMKAVKDALTAIEPHLSETQIEGINYFLTKDDYSLFTMGFDGWWRNTGSGITPIKGHDMEEHAKRIARKAWDEAKS